MKLNGLYFRRGGKMIIKRVQKLFTIDYDLFDIDVTE